MSLTLEKPPPPLLSACPDPSAGASRSRWELWRSPEGQPRWARPALLGIAVAAAVLYAWNITRAGYAPLYSQGVWYMAHSWKLFFYGAASPSVTMDKLAGSFVPQALSARIFGFHVWSLVLPQVIEGVVSVLVMYRVVRRWAGAPAGLLAAGIFALTPVAVSMFGHAMEDGALVMCLVLAADSYQRAVMTGRLRPLVWSAVWVGLGFQAKMLEAWMVVPALAAGYLLTAPAGVRRRLWQLGAAGVVLLAVSLSWIALYTFTPARDRPYISGSTDNSAIAMVFGWNGLSRFGIHVPGAVEGNGTTVPVPSGPSAGTGGGGPPAGTGGGAPGALPSGGGGAPGPGLPPPGYYNIAPSGVGWAKLSGAALGPEIGWLFPAAVLALACGLLWYRRGGSCRQVRGGFVMWGVWLLTFGVIFSGMNTIPHTAYVASLAPPIAALAAAGIVMWWRAYRTGDRRGWVLPAAVAAELAWTGWLWSAHSGFLPWAQWITIAAGAAAVIVLVMARLPAGTPARLATARLATARIATRIATARLATAGLAVGVAVMLAAPATWAASVLDAKYAGIATDAAAGPAGLVTGWVPGVPGNAAPGAQSSALPALPVPSGGSQTIHMTTSIKSAECRRKQGVSNVPNPGPHNAVLLGPQIINSPFYASATSTCQPLSTPLPPLPGIPATPADALKYAECMRAHGVPKFPLPGNQGFNITGNDLGINLNSRVYKAALSACKSYVT